MKKILKYFIAVLLAGSLAIWFLPVVHVSILEISVMDLMKTGLGFYSGTGQAELIYGGIRTYMEPYALYIVGAVALILIEAFLTAVISYKAAYFLSLIWSVLDSVAVGIIFFMVRAQLDETVQEAVFLDMGDTVGIDYLPVVLWFTVCLLILILSVVGIALKSSGKKDDAEEMYIEQIDMLEQENLTQKKEEKKPERMEPQRPAAPLKPREEKTTEKNPIPEERFTGAVVGESVPYMGKAYPLSDTREVFFKIEDGHAVITPYEDPGSLAGVYYIEKYREYCVEPAEKCCFYLESGQPLGKGRKYYLPRGTKVYLKDKNNKFTLA